MRKIEKETLEIINNFQSEKYSHFKKLMTIRENQIKEEVENHLQSFINIERIKNRIEEFKKLYISKFYFGNTFIFYRLSKFI